MNKKLKIEGMSCMHCVKHVKDALLELEGVKDVEVNLEEGFALVDGDNLEEKKLKKAVEEVGYEVIEVM